MTEPVRVEIHEDGLRELMRDPAIRDALMAESSNSIVPRARRDAPKDTGVGAASIHGEPVMGTDGWEVRVSWSQFAYYMSFHEFGTKHIKADPFLRPAAGGAVSLSKGVSTRD